MNTKRVLTSALALALCAGMAPAALAAPEGFTPADGARLPQVVDQPQSKTYQTQLFLNGETLDTAKIPGAQAKLIPMRLLTEADGGFAEWYEDDHQGFFFLADRRLLVDFSDLSVELDGEKLEGVTATLTQGVTFLPADVLAQLDGVEVDLNLELDVDRVDIATPNGRPLNKLANSIIEEVGLNCSQKLSAEELKEYIGVDTANFDEIVAISPLMVNADTLFIGRYAEEADKEAAKEQFDGELKRVQQSFEHYLPDAYDMAMKGQVVESEDGAWLMLVISPDNDKVIELFEAGIAEMDQ